MGLLGLLFGVYLGSKVGEGAGREINVISYKKYDKERHSLYKKYYPNDFMPSFVSASHPKYVEFIEEYNALEIRWGNPPYKTIEQAKKDREEWVKRWKSIGGIIDENGWSINYRDEIVK